MRQLLLILLTTFLLADSYSQANKINICEQDHYHPVDVKAKQLVDSLKKTDVDTLLIYRHWLGTNGFNGYGKVIWLDQGVAKQYQIDFINYNGEYGIKQIIFSVLPKDIFFHFYFTNRLDTVADNPTKQDFRMSHDAEHFIYFDISGKTYCYLISGLLVECNPTHLRAQLVDKLIITDYWKKFIEPKKNDK